MTSDTSSRTSVERTSQVEIWLADGLAPDAPVTALHYLADADASVLEPLLAANLGRPSGRGGSALSGEDGGRVTAIAGADAVRLALQLDRPLRAVAVIRAPLSWTLAQTADDTEPPSTARFAELAASDPDRYANAQSRRLLAAHFDVSDLPLEPTPEEAELWRSRLEEATRHYTFLVESRIAQSADRLVEAFGWRFRTPLLADGKVRTHDSALRRAVERANWLDNDLFRGLVAARRREESERRKTGYRSKVNARSDSEKKGGMTPLDVYLAPTPLAEGVPVNVFHHIPKTAGTAFRALLYANLADTTEFRALRVPRSAEGARVEWNEDERRRLLWIAAHTADHSTPHVDRPVQIVTSVREPLDRVLSRFYFAGRSDKRADKSEARLERILTEERPGKPARRPDYTNGQSRHLLAPHFDLDELEATAGPPDDADLWRERLFELVESYVLLVQDQLARSIQLLGPEWGLDTSQLGRVRVNQERPQPEEVGDGVRELVYAYNWLDLELYRFAVARLTAADTP